MSYCYANDIYVADNAFSNFKDILINLYINKIGLKFNIVFVFIDTLNFLYWF